MKNVWIDIQKNRVTLFDSRTGQSLSAWVGDTDWGIKAAYENAALWNWNVTHEVVALTEN